MPALTEQAVRHQRAMGPLLVLAVLLGLLGLPLAVWLDLRSLSERLLRLQASETSRIIDDMRGFYASDVVGPGAAGPRRGDDLARVPDHPGRDPDPGHAVDRARQADQQP